MSAPSVPARVLGHFIAPREAPPPVVEPLVTATRFAPRAVVLGTPATAPPVAAALANALRAGHRSPAALLAVWAPPDARPRSSGPATPAASRLAGRLTARGLPSAALGRLAWLPLADHPVAAALAARRAAAALEVPVVVALAGPRADPLEAVIREQDLTVVVTGEPEGPLARIALATSPVPAVACSPLSPAARLPALAGIAGARVLGEPARAAVRRLVAAPLVEEW